jgi:hypothetical protein
VQGCLVWGSGKTEAILSALDAEAHCAKALTFAYGCHPADAALLGKRQAHALEVLLRVGGGAAGQRGRRGRGGCGARAD